MTIEEKQQELEHNIRKLYSDIADAFLLLEIGEGQNTKDIAWELEGSYETLHQAEEREQQKDICYHCGDIIKDNKDCIEFFGRTYHEHCARKRFRLPKRRLDEMKTQELIKILEYYQKHS